jgi:hypothetical protein
MIDKELLSELGENLKYSPEQQKPKGAEVIDKGDYLVIKISNPDMVRLNKDREGSGNSYVDTDGSGKLSKGDKVEFNGIDGFVGDEVIMNGPLFGADNKPVGGFIQDGKVVQDFVTPASGGGNFADTNGIIGQKKDGTSFLMSYDEWQNKNFTNSEVSWAIQNGPMLVNDGKNLNNASTPKRDIARTAMGFSDDGSLTMIYTKVPTNMNAVGEYMKQEGVDNAIFLDGANVGFIDNLKTTGQIVDGSTTLHFSQKPTRTR